jgi:hypothetical protein
LDLRAKSIILELFNKMKPIILFNIKIEKFNKSVKILKYLYFLPGLREIIRKNLYKKLFVRELKFMKNYFKTNKNT